MIYYKVMNVHTGKVLESHGSAYLAQRACMILNAHSIKNGLESRYEVDVPMNKRVSVEELNLPLWAEIYVK